MANKKSGQRKKRKTNKFVSALKALVKMVCIIAALAIAFVLFTNIYMIQSVKDRIVSVDEAVALAGSGNPPQCIEVLGASVRGDKPSLILADRLDKAFELYGKGSAPVLLFSGDNGRVEYNEVEAMRKYAIAHGEAYGITKENIYLDHAGFSTYESMYRLKEVFGADSAIIVTQKYHLYRALYTAKKQGIDVYGVVASPRKSGQFARDVREVLARTKDFCYVIFDVQPKYLGEPVELKPAGGE